MKKIALFGVLLAFFCIVNHTEANDNMNALNAKEQKIYGTRRHAETENRAGGRA